MRFEFEWGIAQTGSTEWTVFERLVGTELRNEFKVPTMRLAENVVKARRRFVDSMIRDRAGAVKLFEHQPGKLLH